MASDTAYTLKAGKIDKHKLAEKILKCFKRASGAWEKQITRERDDLRFQVPELQWDETARRQRLGLNIGDVPTPARPVLSVPKISQPISIILGGQRSAHLSVDINPVNEEANDDTAEVLEELYRQIERDSNAHVPRSWAFERGVKAGRGAYRIVTEYDPEGGSPFDQKIIIKRIMDQEAVLWDPTAQEADFSDANWCIVRTWMPREDFEAEFGEAAASGVGDKFVFADQGEIVPEWTKGDGEDQAFLVAEYYWKQKTKRTYCLCKDGQVYEKGDVPRETSVERSHEVMETEVWWTKVGPRGDLVEGDEDEEGPMPLQFLEDPRNTGIDLIPVMAYSGQELVPFDAERRWVGMIGPAKDAQRLYNFAASTAVEVAALEPKAPWLVEAGQIEGFEGEWQQQNVRNFPYLRWKAVSLDGTPVPPPNRIPSDQNKLGPSIMLLQQADGFMQSATAVFNPLLGKTDEEYRSGRAVLALQNQGDQATSSYLQNLVDVTMNYEARVILALIPVVYDRPGRIARTLDAEGQSDQVMFGAPYYKHPETGTLVRLQQTEDGQIDPQQPIHQKAKVQHFDLSKGRYGVAIKIGKSYPTRLAEGQDAIGQVMQRVPPEYIGAILPIWAKFLDFPGHHELSDVLGKIRDQQMPFLKTEAEGDPKQLAAQVQALQGQVQQAGQALQQAQQAIQTKQAEQQAKIQVAQLTAQLQLKLKTMDNATKIEVARIQAARAEMDTAAAAHEEEIALAMEQVGADKRMAHEVAIKILEHRHEGRMARLALLTDQDQRAHDSAHDSALSAQEHLQDLHQAAHAASLGPILGEPDQVEGGGTAPPDGGNGEAQTPPQGGNQ